MCILSRGQNVHKSQNYSELYTGTYKPQDVKKVASFTGCHINRVLYTRGSTGYILWHLRFWKISLSCDVTPNKFVIQGISGFLDFIHPPVFEGTRRFGNWICFRPQVKGGGGGRIQWLRLALSKGPNWVGVFFTHHPPFTWGQKQIQFPKRRVPSNTGRWIKSRNPEIPCVIQHRHNPSETAYSMLYNVTERIINTIESLDWIVLMEDTVQQRTLPNKEMGLWVQCKVGNILITRATNSLLRTTLFLRLDTVLDPVTGRVGP
jgi:hypothetical protein